MEKTPRWRLKKNRQFFSTNFPNQKLIVRDNMTETIYSFYIVWNKIKVAKVLIILWQRDKNSVLSAFSPKLFGLMSARKVFGSSLCSKGFSTVVLFMENIKLNWHLSRKLLSCLSTWARYWWTSIIRMMIHGLFLLTVDFSFIFHHVMRLHFSFFWSFERLIWINADVWLIFFGLSSKW